MTTEDNQMIRDLEPGYQGYANYATWNVCLWVNNDEPIYLQMLAYPKTYAAWDERHARAFCEYVFGPDGTPDMSTQPCDTWDDVDWAEVVENFNESCEEEA